MTLDTELGNVMVDCLLNFLRQWVNKCYTTFTHSCSCLALPLVWTFVRLYLCAKELFSHYVYEHSHVRTHNANRHLSSLTRVWKTASRASATNGEANDAINDEANMWLVRLSFASLFTSPLARLCKFGITVYFNSVGNSQLERECCLLIGQWSVNRPSDMNENAADNSYLLMYYLLLLIF